MFIRRVYIISEQTVIRMEIKNVYKHFCVYFPRSRLNVILDGESFTKQSVNRSIKVENVDNFYYTFVAIMVIFSGNRRSTEIYRKWSTLGTR